MIKVAILLATLMSALKVTFGQSCATSCTSTSPYCCPTNNEGPMDQLHPEYGTLCKSQLPQEFIEVENMGDSSELACDPGLCVNDCEWQTPEGLNCKIGPGSHFGDYVCANLIFQGDSIGASQYLTNCNVKVEKVQLSGIWTCISNIKTQGKFVDFVNVTVVVPDFADRPVRTKSWVIIVVSVAVGAIFIVLLVALLAILLRKTKKQKEVTNSGQQKEILDDYSIASEASIESTFQHHQPVWGRDVDRYPPPVTKISTVENSATIHPQRKVSQTATILSSKYYS